MYGRDERSGRSSRQEFVNTALSPLDPRAQGNRVPSPGAPSFLPLLREGGRSIADPGGSTRSQNARRGAESSHALRRWLLLRRQIQEQPAAHAGAGKRLAGHAPGGDDRPARSSPGHRRREPVAAGTHARPAHGTLRPALHVYCRPLVRLALCYLAARRPGLRLSAGIDDSRMSATFATLPVSWRSTSGRATPTAARLPSGRSRANASSPRASSTRATASMPANGHFPDSPLRGVFGRNDVYACVTSWDSFEPWLSRIENFSRKFAVAAGRRDSARMVRLASDELEQLLTRLLTRRSRVRELILDFKNSCAQPVSQLEGDGALEGGTWQRSGTACKVAERTFGYLAFDTCRPRSEAPLCGAYVYRVLTTTSHESAVRLEDALARCSAADCQVRRKRI